VAKEDRAKEEKPETVKVPEFYTVQPKETIFSISKKFGVKVEEIKKLNPGLSELKVGQRLRLSGSPENNTDATNIETAEEKEYQEKPEQTKKTETKRADTPVEKRNYVTVKDPKIITQPESNVPTFSNLKKDGYTKVNETGLAELYQDNSGFHYALHKTAPVGTIIYVVNEENGQKVYVRVMGRLTDAGTGVVIKLSPKAYDKVSKGSSKVKVNLTYIP
jgi:LysM repeat protein